jgi:hypothetical protein
MERGEMCNMIITEFVDRVGYSPLIWMLENRLKAKPCKSTKSSAGKGGISPLKV